MIYRFFVRICLSIVSIAVADFADAQQNPVVVHGRLIDQNNNPVQYAHVVNRKKSFAGISDTAGNFRTIMLPGDTVRISAVGFATAFISLSDCLINHQTHIAYTGDIIMNTVVYNLPTVNIYSERWQSFLYDYSQEEYKEAPYKKQIEHWKENLINTDELKQLSRAANGTGFSLNFNRKHAKQEQKILEAKKQDELNRLAYEKYNPSVVSQITGLSHEESVSFIEKYRLDRDFILQRNDYDLCLIIQQLFQAYTSYENH